jgi:hypothetical protein
MDATYLSQEERVGCFGSEGIRVDEKAVHQLLRAQRQAPVSNID